MLFEVRIKYDRSDAIAFVRGVRASRFGRIYRAVSRTLRVVLGLWFLRAGLTGLKALFGGLVLENAASCAAVVIPALVLLLLGIYLVFRGVFDRAPLTEWQVHRSFSRHGENDVYRFLEGHYEMALDHSFHSLDYSNIKAVLEDRDHYFLFLNKNTAHILNKSQFTTGRPNEFGAFISTKTGAVVKRV